MWVDDRSFVPWGDDDAEASQFVLPRYQGNDACERGVGWPFSCIAA